MKFGRSQLRFKDSGCEAPLAPRAIIWAEANGDGVCSVVVPKHFARTQAEILDIEAQVSFLGRSLSPVRWFGVSDGLFYPYDVPVLHLNEMVLF